MAAYLLALTCLPFAHPAFADSFCRYDEYSNPQGILAEVHTNLAANTPFVITNLIDTNSGAKFYRVRPPP